MSALTFFAYFFWLSKKSMLGFGDNVPNKCTDEKLHVYSNLNRFLTSLNNNEVISI